MYWYIHNSCLGSASPKFLAWCSGAQSHIKVVNIETKEEHANFNGAPAYHLASIMHIHLIHL